VIDRIHRLLDSGVLQLELRQSDIESLAERQEPVTRGDGTSTGRYLTTATAV
jgi:hypothetical protein